jgi:hypothetical protein
MRLRPDDSILVLVDYQMGWLQSFMGEESGSGEQDQNAGGQEQ